MLIDAVEMERLVARWRVQAGGLRALEAIGQAAAFTVAANDLEALVVATGEQLLSLTSAARESGYSADHLGRMVRRGELPNAGRENAPKVRRSAVPVKPGHLRPPLNGSSLPASREQIALAAITPFRRGAHGQSS